MNIVDQKQAKRVEKQIVQCVLSHPFWATLLLRMKIVQDPTVPTFCTDGVSIFYSPEFCASLPDDQVLGVLIHEVGHPALGHLWRKGSRDHKMSNIAADHALNNYLEEYCNEQVQAGRPRPFDLPAGGCCDPRFKGQSFEEIYATLAGEQQNPGQGDGDQPSYGEFTDPASGKDGEGNESNTEGDWMVAVAQAAQSAKMQGKASASTDRFLKEVGSPKVRWTEVLNRFVTELSADDYSNDHFDRRYIDDGFYFPDLKNESMGEIAVVFDTSGSVDLEMLGQFKSELIDIFNTVRPSKVVVMYADSAVCNTEEFTQGDDLTLHPKGGGGTDFRPALKELSERPVQPQCCVYITDGYGTHATESPDYPVLWCITPGGDDRVPFGEVVRMN